MNYYKMLRLLDLYLTNWYQKNGLIAINYKKNPDYFNYNEIKYSVSHCIDGIETIN